MDRLQYGTLFYGFTNEATIRCALGIKGLYYLIGATDINISPEVVVNIPSYRSRTVGDGGVVEVVAVFTLTGEVVRGLLVLTRASRYWSY